MKKIKVALGSAFGTLALLPAMALAQVGNIKLTNLGNALQDFRTLMNMIVPILIGLAVIVFLFGVLRFVFNAGNEDKRADGKWMMIYGIIGIVVMVSVWGLVTFVQQTFGIDRTQSVTGPQLP